eukprot:1928489-Rhodomonas_salina.4
MGADADGRGGLGLRGAGMGPEMSRWKEKRAASALRSWHDLDHFKLNMDWSRGAHVSRLLTGRLTLSRIANSDSEAIGHVGVSNVLARLQPDELGSRAESESERALVAVDAELGSEGKTRRVRRVSLPGRTLDGFSSTMAGSKPANGPDSQRQFSSGGMVGVKG